MIIIRRIIIKDWILIVLVFIPVINFLAFLRMTRLDNELRREQFFKTLLVTTIVQFILELINFIIRLTSNYCSLTENINSYYCSSNYIVLMSIEGIITFTLEIYFIIIARQNYLNMRDSMGDNIAI